MCKCLEMALGKGYIVRRSAYDEVKKDFVDLDTYYMPIRTRSVNLSIEYCPFCGKKLFEEKK